MWKVMIAICIFGIVTTDGRILLYDTKNDSVAEKFDCIYYVYNDGEEIPYCQRLSGSEEHNRVNDGCTNQDEIKSFLELLRQGVKPSDVLSWSSSVEMAEMYASIFYNRTSPEKVANQFLCNCTRPGTFGKSCEYQLPHNAKSFPEAIQIQFQQKKNGDSWNTQRYGKILCYQTLPCHSGDLCLDWRDICNGFQQCLNGIDEENWDKLEFNECEDDEFRCTNGMCIAEEFWLDGDYDCMDWSDELSSRLETDCSFDPNAMECDEHICSKNQYACGDGECVSWITRMAFQRFVDAPTDCFTKRNLNYMCEVSPHRPAWTREDGLCALDVNYNDPRYPSWDQMNSSNVTADEKCQYLVRCGFSDGFEQDCPCKSQNCSLLLMNVCPFPLGKDSISYPSRGLINPNAVFFYDATRPLKNSNFVLFFFTGNIRCRGYQMITDCYIAFTVHQSMLHTTLSDNILCRVPVGSRNSSSIYQLDPFCWNETLTFNDRPYPVEPDICSKSGDCMSQYRIRDGTDDCTYSEDEKIDTDKDYCTQNVKRHRFQCFDNKHKCLPLHALGDQTSDCSNHSDERWHGTGGALKTEIQCRKGNDAGCSRLREYINESLSNQHSSSAQIPFRSYCDSFWDMHKHTDELAHFCEQWICREGQYQCQTGQCIELGWVCDGEWDCADASDEEAIILNKTRSLHNTRLFPNWSHLLDLCKKRYSEAPFFDICNTSLEFGCYLSKVSDPLDIKSHRPCINLTQIGDGVEDCFNAYDERNTFEIPIRNVWNMWGFYSQCGINDDRYPVVCEGLPNNCTKILCSNHRAPDKSCSNPKDVICLENNDCHKDARCDNKRHCAHAEDEYWCARNTNIDQILYRAGKNELYNEMPVHVSFPPFPNASRIESNQQPIQKATVNYRDANFSNAISYQCNRGLAVFHLNETECLCPPAYFGRQCEFYSDRISIIVRFEEKNFLKTESNTTFKIKANFLFDGRIIDQHEFHVVPTFGKAKIAKHRFYLLYLRSPQMLAYKRWRYANRTDVINNHPYSINFDIYAWLSNQSTPVVFGSWHYPIYFDFLPSFRLATVLRFPYWFGNSSLDPCENHTCNENSTCKPMLNQNNSYVCACNNGFYGTNCSKYEDACNTYCSSGSFCQPDDRSLISNTHNPFCLCPVGYFGPRCLLRFAQCDSDPCLNNGSCVYTYESNTDDAFVCTCLKLFYGDRCQHLKMTVQIQLNTGITIESPSASSIQFYDISKTLELVLRHQQVTRGFPSTILYAHGLAIAPALGVLKAHYDSIQPKYFIIYLQLNTSTVNISSPLEHCPLASSLLNENDFPNVPDVFKYHQICRNHSQRLCFIDTDYLCICQSGHYRVDCLMHDIQIDHCTKCLYNGKCVRGDINEPNDFICLCPRCHQGRLCEFNMQAFGFTLDSLLADSLKATKIVYLSIAFLLFILGLFNNLCSFVTFRRPTPRKFGVGNYLFITTCLNQISLLWLLVKIIQITFEIMNTESCKSVSYLSSVFTRLTYWLTSWITIDRVLITLFSTSVALKNPRLSIGISIVTSFCLFGMHIHEIIYYTTIQHLSTGSPICVTNFDTRSISTFNRASTLIHYLLPFFIQVIAITLLIILAARSRNKATDGKVAFRQVLTRQFHTQKELYITPIIIILSALPQTIFTFSLACTELTIWRRHALLITYLLSYAPQTLGFILYVLPSTSYKKEFRETSLGRSLSWLFNEEKSTSRVIKTK